MRKTRRAWGTGSISKPDANGWIWVRLRLGIVDGKPKRVVRRVRTAAEARAALDAMQKQFQPGSDSQAAPKLGEYLESWLQRSAVRLKPKTLRTYRTAVDNLSPLLGHVRINALTPTLLSNAFAALGAQKRQAAKKRHEQSKGAAETADTGERTVQQAYDILRIALNFAVRRDQILVASPLPAVPRIKIDREIDFLSKAEVLKLFEALKTDRLRCLFRLAVATGMRWGEMSALRWRDVELEGHALTIRHQRTEKGVLASTKTRGSRRRIDLPPSVVIELKAHRARQRKELGGESEFVFVSTTGTPLHASNVERRHFFPALARAKLRKIRFHDLRHTAATIRLASGQHPKLVSELLGHASIATTLSLYSHVLPGLGKEAAEAYDRAMDAKSS